MATIAYGICLALLFYNCRWYLCKESRYKQFYVMSFYILSITIILTRFVSYFILIIYFYKPEPGTLSAAQDIQSLAIYGDIVLGFFQVAAMYVLSLQLRFPKQDLTRKERNIYVCVVISGCLFTLGVILDVLLSAVCFKQVQKKKFCEVLGHQNAQRLNAIWFSILFVLMLVIAVPLCRVIHEKTGGNRTLASNVKRLTNIFMIFCIGFLTRAIYDFLADVNGRYFVVFLGLALPLFWDWLPIFLMARFHLDETKIERREQIATTATTETNLAGDQSEESTSALGMNVHESGR